MLKMPITFISTGTLSHVLSTVVKKNTFLIHLSPMEDNQNIELRPVSIVISRTLILEKVMRCQMTSQHGFQ